MDKHAFMRQALDLACQNVTSGHGGPFGAVVVKDGQIIGMGVNEVTDHNDPTAHAEIQAIRDACRKLGSFQLSGCEIYTSCEPCPMCLGAIYWARPRAVCYALTREEAAAIGFDDAFIYDQIPLPPAKRSLPMEKMDLPASGNPFEAWAKSDKRVDY